MRDIDVTESNVQAALASSRSVAVYDTDALRTEPVRVIVFNTETAARHWRWRFNAYRGADTLSAIH